VTDLAARLQDALGAAYRVERELPLGGLGRLFLAIDAAGSAVVVQVLPPDIAARLDPQRFVRQVERVSRLRHPHLLPVVAAGAQGDLVWCVAPRPAGESVRFRLQRDGGLAADEVVQVLHDVADALAYGHGQGIGHGDLKPDSIYLVGGRAVLADYGLRSSLAAALDGETADPRADVHALAVAGEQMLGGTRPPLREVLERALSIDAGEHYTSAEALREAVGTPPSARRLRARRRVVAAAVLLGLLGLLVVRQLSTRQPLDPDVVAVAPFEVLDPAHGLWREGLVTLVSGNLDGAGPLRTVSPTVVIRSWQGTADAQSAAALGRRTGAGLVLFGRVVRVGGDSVRITASLVDATAQRTLAEVQLVDAESRLDQMGDLLTVRVLEALARTRPIGAVRRASLGSSSLTAMKAFLLGEQFYRRSEWDSALAHYQDAIALDSTFALALYRAGIVTGWRLTASDTLSTNYLKRAAAHNRALPPRESLLVTAESLSAALEEGSSSPGYWRNYRRLYATVDAATRRYPRDPEAWYERGEMRYHYNLYTTFAETRVAFDHAILLDSAFAPAYIHPVELALQMGDPDGARAYLDRYLALRTRDTYADAAQLTLALLDPRRAASPEVTAILDTASLGLLTATIQSFGGWPDTLRTAIRLLHHQLALQPSAAESAAVRQGLADEYLYHGQLGEAYAALGERANGLYVALAWAGGINPSRAEAWIGAALNPSSGAPFTFAVQAAPWWATRGDSMSLRALEREAERRGRQAPPPQRLYYRFAADAARAFQALVRGDTTGALARFTALPDTACGTCTLYAYVRAGLLAAAGPDSVAQRVLARDPPGFSYPLAPFWMLWRARVAARAGDRDGAVAAYRYVRDAWQAADPSLQPHVREATAALARLGAR